MVPSIFSEPMHVDWTKAWLGTLRELQAYIKDHHTTGVTWNPQVNNGCHRNI